MSKDEKGDFGAANTFLQGSNSRHSVMDYVVIFRTIGYIVAGWIKPELLHAARQIDGNRSN
jgi:hypothetical protein